MMNDQESEKQGKIVYLENTMLREAHACSSISGNFTGILRSGMILKPSSLRGSWRRSRYVKRATLSSSRSVQEEGRVQG